MKKPRNISTRQRSLLHRLLHRDLHECRIGALVAAERLGWVGGAGSGYELTVEGRRVAEESEQSAETGSLQLQAVESALILDFNGRGEK